jgi:hypothetical protein
MQRGDNSISGADYRLAMRSRQRIRAAGLVVQGALAVAGLLAARPAVGQDTPAISGAVAFLHNTTRGQTAYDPTIMPVAVVPVTRHFLFESRGSFLEAITPRNGQSYKTRLNRNFAYLQLDVLANRHATFIAGKFQTPFATYNERLSPIWIGNFQDGPLIFSIGNNNSAGTGGEVKGSLASSNTVNVDYAAYYSATVTSGQFQSSRATGGRISAYFPASRMEVGASYGRLFAGAHENASGAHFWWEPGALALRSEYAHGTHAQGYWIETAYRLSRWTGPESALGRLQPVFRMQQVFRNSPDATDGLPSADTQRTDFGLDYFLPHEVRVNTSYSRQFSSTGNGNIWKTALVYRFLFPAWPGRRR